MSWRLVAIFALALNLLLAGAIAGAALGGARLAFGQDHERKGEGHGRGRDMLRPAPSPMVILRELPPEARREVRERLGQAFREARPEREAASAARLAMLDAVSAEPFDRARLDAAFDAMLEADAAVQRKIHNGAVDAIAALDPETRRRAAAAFREAIARRGPPLPEPPRPPEER